MGYKVRVTFAEGITADDMDNLVIEAGGDPNVPPPGSLSHNVSMANGQLVYTDEWESKEAFEGFIMNMGFPMMDQAGIPRPTIEEL